MLELSLGEKFKAVLNLISTRPYFILLVVFAFIVYFLLFESTKQTVEKRKHIYLSTYLLIILALLIKYHSGLWALFDHLIDNLTSIFYFPNFAAYVLMIIIANIILLKSLFSKKISERLKKINIAIYCIETYLLFLSLDIISKNSLNIFIDTSLYSNVSLMSVIQIHNVIFIIWLGILFLDKISTKLADPKMIIVKENTVKNSYSLKTKYSEIPKMFSLKEEQPRTIYKSKTIKEPDIFTKEEYLMVLKILKEKKSLKEKNI